MAAGSAAVLTAFLTNLYIFLGCFGAFSFLRLRPWARRFFAARRYAKDIDLKPKRLPNGYLNWIIPVIFYKEADIIDEAGLDCAMYLRILRFGVILCFTLTIVCILLVLPPNMTGNAIDQILLDQEAGKETESVQTNNGKELKFTDFDHYSLSNVAAGSPTLWCHLVAIYFVVLFTLWLLWRFNKQSVLLRLLFLGNCKRGGPSHTVLVTDIPGVSDAVSKALRDESARKAALKKQMSKQLSMKKEIGVQADSTGANLGDPSLVPPPVMDTPSKGAPLPAAVSKRVMIMEPNKAGEDGAGMEGSGLPVSTGAGAGPATVAVATEPASYSKLDTPFARGAAISAIENEADLLPSDPSATNPDAIDGPAEAKSGLSFMKMFEMKSSGSCSKYTLYAEVDPKYAATGGKLEMERLGKSNSQIIKELQNIEPEDLLKTMPATYGVDTQPLPPDRRNTKRFEYNTDDPKLDPSFLAKKKLKSGLTPQQMVAREFSKVYAPQNIAAVNMIQATGPLEPLVKEYNQIAMELEDYLEMAKLRLKLRKEVPQKTKSLLRVCYGKWDYLDRFPGKVFAKVDVVEFWLARLAYLRERIKEEQPKCMGKAAPSAFVTFNTRMAQAVSSNSLLCHSEADWRVVNAPAPFEVVWMNLSMGYMEKMGRLYILWAAFWAMACFFMIPVAAIQALIEVPKLAKLPVLGPIVTAPAMRQIIEALVPGLVLKIFLAIVPIILRIMALLSGSTSISEIDFGVVKRFFLFQVVVVFFGSMFAGSFFNQLEQWVNDPGSAISTLGKSIPMTSTFFITYMLVNGLGAKSFAFIRLPNFIIFYLLSKFAGSPRARQRMWTYQYTNNGTTVVDHTIAMLLVLTFSCINPIMCVVGLAYFLVNFLGETYNNVYVLRREYESGGRLWQTVYNQVMVSLYLMQLVMFALLLIKKFAFVFFIIPLAVFSVGCHFSTLQLFSRPWSVTALQDAATMDLVEADERRMNLLAQAREERKKRRDREKRSWNEAVRKAEENGDPPPPWDPKLDVIVPGKSEKLLMESLEGDGFALNSEEKREIAEMYLNPVFKVPLEDVDRLTKMAIDVQSRVPRLNKWVKEYRQWRRAVKMFKRRGETDLPPPPKMPEDLTIFDTDPNLVDSDDDDSTSKSASLPGGGEAAAIGGPSGPLTKPHKRGGGKEMVEMKEINGENRV